MGGFPEVQLPLPITVFCEKTGAESYLSKARKPRRIGIAKRIQFRKNIKKSKHTMRRYRVSYKLMHTLAKKYTSGLKNFGPPGSFDERNQHGGVMPSLPGDVHLTGRQAATILEKCADHEISYEQFRSISGCLSYIYQLVWTGDYHKKMNWPEVTKMFRAYSPDEFRAPVRPLKPEHVPSPEQLRAAFTKGWTVNCGWSLCRWWLGLLCCWTWAVLGNRSNCDVAGLRDSRTHTLSAQQGWAATAMKGGRNKLCDRKAGSRPWSGYFVCLCPEGKHQEPPEDFEDSLEEDGNPTTPPTFCTSCPLAALDIRTRLAGENGMKIFGKWSKGRYFGQNIGKPVTLA